MDLQRKSISAFQLRERQLPGTSSKAQNILDASFPTFNQGFRDRLFLNVCASQMHLSLEAELLLKVSAVPKVSSSAGQSDFDPSFWKPQLQR